VSAQEGEWVATRCLAQPLPTDLEAFYQAHQDTWRRYAYAQTGLPEAAEQIVDSLTAQLANLWQRASGGDDPGRYAWAVLKTTIVRWLNDHQTRPAFVETVAFDRVALAMDFVREQFNLIEESLALYTAISRLPERQYDVLVLHYVLGYPTGQVAFVLGLDPTDVKAHIRAARERLTQELGRHPEPDHE
jgi:RNA polymerase sigma-70 factor (ECF subfamily)